MLPELSLEGRTAIVTGGGRGIGREIALALAEAGADVVVAARTVTEIEAVAEEVRGLGRRALAVPADATASSDVDRLVDEVIRAFGQVDIMVNNAGVLFVLPLVPVPGGGPDSLRLTRPSDSPMRDGEWEASVATNLSSVMYGCRAVAPYMLERGYGKIVNVTSINGRQAVPFTAAYSATKAAVEMLTRVLALEWAEHGVRVNALAPGSYHTQMTDHVWSDPAASRQSRETIPMGHPGDLRELGVLAVYLASPASDYMTGQAVVMDGGKTAR